MSYQLSEILLYIYTSLAIIVATMISFHLKVCVVYSFICDFDLCLEGQFSELNGPCHLHTISNQCAKHEKPRSKNEERVRVTRMGKLGQLQFIRYGIIKSSEQVHLQHSKCGHLIS